MKVSAVSFRIREISSFQDFVQHIEDLVRQVSVQEANLAVLPELLTLELLHLAPGIKEHQIPSYLASFESEYLASLENLAKSYSLAIVGGSTISRNNTNICPVVSPDGQMTFHPKNILTQWEAVEWGLNPGIGNPDPCLPNLGVLVCYDSEFPEATRLIAENGAKLLVVPSYTETQRGYQRVRWSCLARAIENQIFVAHSALVGSLGREPVAQTYGSSAILAPSIEPFPVSAILSETKFNDEDIATAPLDFGLLENARNTGDVRNWNDRNLGRWHL